MLGGAKYKYIAHVRMDDRGSCRLLKARLGSFRTIIEEVMVMCIEGF